MLDAEAVTQCMAGDDALSGARGHPDYVRELTNTNYR